MPKWKNCTEGEARVHDINDGDYPSYNEIDVHKKLAREETKKRL